LIIANQAATSSALIAELRDRTQRGPVCFHLVVPALNSRLRHWLSDTDDAVLTAHQRGEDARAVMAAHGIPVSVEIGDGVPLLAIADALAQFEADEILIATLPASRSHWLEHNLINHSRRRFGLPVHHVIDVEEVARGVGLGARRSAETSFARTRRRGVGESRSAAR
jgi:GABA permease